MKYNNHLNYQKRRKFILKVRLAFLMFFVVLIAGGVLFYIKYVGLNTTSPNTNTVSESTMSNIAPTFSVFRSPYFQFQASNDWVEVPNESNKNKFVYRKLNKTLLEHDLTIYVNQIPGNLQPTRVLPVKIDDPTQFEPQKVSEGCGKALDKNKQIKDVQVVDFKGVNFLCYGKISPYNVIVGKIGGDTNMTLARPDGTTAVYSIYYRDFRAINGSEEIDTIIQSFQTR